MVDNMCDFPSMPFQGADDLFRFKKATNGTLINVAADGYSEIKYKSAISYEEYLSMVKSLESGQFITDLHIENLLVFAPGTHFYAYHLYLNGSIILQDKASCFPVAALDVQPGCVALDACSALDGDLAAAPSLADSSRSSDSAFDTPCGTSSPIPPTPLGHGIKARPSVSPPHLHRRGAHFDRWSSGCGRSSLPSRFT